jgi:hypothetical protein
MARPKNEKLRDFVLRHVEAHEAGIATFAARELGVTRASVNLYLKDLVEEGLLEASGATRGRRYRLRTLVRTMAGIDLGQTPREDLLWRDRFGPHLAGLPQNVLRICEAGFCEIMGNAIAHSEGRNALVQIKRTYAKLVIRIFDDGTGIFDKIAGDLGLAGRGEAVLELAKGKLSTGGAGQAGEGIFLACRLFDVFTILSGGIGFTARRTSTGDYALETAHMDQQQKGTSVQMEIRTDAPQTIGQVGAMLGDRAGNMTIPLKLAQCGGEQLVSRAQARRIMRRAENLAQVWLDFRGVDEIGQSFADELFRVWSGDHPQISLQALNISRAVDLTIGHAQAHSGSLGLRQSTGTAKAA